jgi:hypothetical protein
LHDGTITVTVPDTMWVTDADQVGPGGPLRGVRGTSRAFEGFDEKIIAYRRAPV